MLKLVLKLVWFGFGCVGLFIIIKQYYPNFPKNLAQPGFVKGIQSELVSGIDPNEAAQIIGKVLSQEVAKTLSSTGKEITQFPVKQVRKIKINACEGLLEEDICSVAKEANCQ